MKTETVKLSKLKANPSNPRVLRDEKFAKLKKSIQDFPDMLNYRAIVAVTDKDGKLMVLGGNMRLRALQELGMKEAPVMLADHWTEEQRREFIIKDNVGFGEWDWDALGNEWDAGQLSEWGLDVPKFAEAPDYSILDEEDASSQLQDMANGVKKAIQIEFEAEHYDEAYELVKYWREQGGYVGGMIMEFLKNEKARG
jgi:ParB-like chromosome segregation protein Spo0J